MPLYKAASTSVIVSGIDGSIQFATGGILDSDPTNSISSVTENINSKYTII